MAPEAHQHILEIGPGLGALTLPLAARAGRIVAVERDPALADALQDVVPETVEVVEQDILGARSDRMGSPAPPECAA